MIHLRYLLDQLGEPFAELVGICPDWGLPLYAELPEPDRPDLVVEPVEVAAEDLDWWAAETRDEAQEPACCGY